MYTALRAPRPAHVHAGPGAEPADMHTGIHTSAHVPPTPVVIAFNCRQRAMPARRPEGGRGAGLREWRPGGSRYRAETRPL